MFLKDIVIVGVLCMFHVRVAATLEARLRNYLFSGYDKLVRPVTVASTVVPVSVQITPLALRLVDLQYRTLKLDTWLTVQWKDEYLQWDSVEFEGIETLRVPVSEVWRPDIAVYKGTPDSSCFPQVETNVIIHYDGDMLWAPPFTIQNRCPFLDQESDRLECDISLLSWAYDSSQLDLDVKYNSTYNFFEDTHPEWNLESFTPVKGSKVFSSDPEVHSTINFKVVLTKKYIEAP